MVAAAPFDVRGLVLAAGAGTRFGGPKALAITEAGEPWVALVADALARGGCSEVTVVLGAEAAAAAALVPDFCSIVRADDWMKGLSASVRAGLLSVADADAIVVAPVDVPMLPPAAVARAIGAASGRRDALVQATYDGQPGHPVVIGETHRTAIAETVTGDRGAGAYLREHRALAVACDDLWSGADIDVRCA